MTARSYLPSEIWWSGYYQTLSIAITDLNRLLNRHNIKNDSKYSQYTSVHPWGKTVPRHIGIGQLRSTSQRGLVTGLALFRLTPVRIDKLRHSCASLWLVRRSEKKGLRDASQQTSEISNSIPFAAIEHILNKRPFIILPNSIEWFRKKKRNLYFVLGDLICAIRVPFKNCSFSSEDFFLYRNDKSMRVIYLYIKKRKVQICKIITNFPKVCLLDDVLLLVFGRDIFHKELIHIHKKTDEF